MADKEIGVEASDTPRTDEAEAKWGNSNVFAGFTRQLERELAQAIRNREEVLRGDTSVRVRVVLDLYDQVKKSWEARCMEAEVIAAMRGKERGSGC